MKNFKKNVLVKGFILILAVLALGSCKKDNDSGDGDVNVGAGKGTFKINGQTYEGLCQSVPATSGASGKIDVIIATQNGGTFTVYNLGTGSSGSTNVINFDEDYEQTSTETFALCILGQENLYHSTSGTVTKTGSNSYKFDINMVNTINNQTTTASGSGKF